MSSDDDLKRIWDKLEEICVAVAESRQTCRDCQRRLCRLEGEWDGNGQPGAKRTIERLQTTIAYSAALIGLGGTVLGGGILAVWLSR